MSVLVRLLTKVKKQTIPNYSKKRISLYIKQKLIVRSITQFIKKAKNNIWGKHLTGTLGTAYRDHLVKCLADGVRGSADLVAYFYLNNFDLNKRTLAMVSSLAIQDPVNPTIVAIIIRMWWRMLL